MKILLQQGGHSFVNLGDLAMLQAAVRRFRESFPDCSITVLSDPGIVASEYVDNVFAIDVHTVPRIFGPGCLFGRFTRVLGTKDSAIVTRYPVFMHGVSLRYRVRGRSADPIARFIRVLSEADIVAATLMKELGLDQRKCVVTGDDALELPYAAARAGIGTKLGVNLRRAFYSGISSDIESRVSKVLSRLLAELQTRPVVIPIDFQENDTEVGAKLLGHTSLVSSRIEVSDAIRLASECRVVITGSYHAAIFALGQGVPAVCLAGSDYYRDKFLGLASQFSSGCLVVETNSEGFEKNAADSVTSLWKTAEALRPRLLESAKVQVELSRSHYREFAHGRAVGLH